MLLLNEFQKLNKKPFFNKEINAYLAELITITDEIVQHYESLPPVAVSKITRELWRAAKYLSGTSVHNVPYEIVHCLKLALDEWNATPRLITTALTDDPDFHFLYWQLGNVFKFFTKTPGSATDIVQIAFPALYRHKPLYILALYHELGHFIDKKFSITDWSLRIDPVPKDRQDQEESHREEYFSDLFAVSYAGTAFIDFLESFAAGNPASRTHPATSERVSVMRDFLAARSNAQVDRINKVLTDLSLPVLSIRYTKPSIEESFENLCTYRFKDNKELHGIFEAGFEYLEKIKTSPNSLWDKLDEFQKDKVLNDLIEKSIRNKMITEAWEHANT